MNGTNENSGAITGAVILAVLVAVGVGFSFLMKDDKPKTATK